MSVGGAFPRAVHAWPQLDAAPCPSSGFEPAGSRGSRGSRGDVTSVGITYFAGRSSRGDDAHLATALTSELARQLLSARIVTPASRRGSPPTRSLLTVRLSESGGPNDVDLAMTGSVFRMDSLVRTSVKVTRTSDGALLWSGTRTRPILELPILARIVAQEVVARVGAQLTTPLPKAVDERSSDVYELILRGAYVRSRYAPDDLRSAIGFFDQALGLDPTSARAKDLRETARLRLLTWGGSGDEVEMSLVSRGMLRRILDRDRDESEQLLDEADAEMRDEQYVHACKLLNAAIDNDAHSSPAYALRSLIRARAGQVREAFADAETVTQLGRPRWGDALRAIVLRRSGDAAGARREVARMVGSVRAHGGTLSFWDARLIATAMAQTGDWTGAQAMLKRVNPDDPRLAWTRSDPLLQLPIPSARPASRRQ